MMENVIGYLNIVVQRAFYWFSLEVYVNEAVLRARICKLVPSAAYYRGDRKWGRNMGQGALDVS
jgi:hypothetical protein